MWLTVTGSTYSVSGLHAHQGVLLATMPKVWELSWFATGVSAGSATENNVPTGLATPVIGVFSCEGKTNGNYHAEEKQLLLHDYHLCPQRPHLHVSCWPSRLQCPWGQLGQELPQRMRANGCDAPSATTVRTIAPTVIAKGVKTVFALDALLVVLLCCAFIISPCFLGWVVRTKLHFTCVFWWDHLCIISFQNGFRSRDYRNNSQSEIHFWSNWLILMCKRQLDRRYSQAITNSEMKFT